MLGIANPRTDTNVTANITVTANFAINTFTLTYTAGSNGSLSGNTTQTVNYNGSGTAVTAVPNTGYHFVNWSDASTANPRTDTNVTANISVTANFATNTFTLTYNAGAGGTISGNITQTISSGGNGTPVQANPIAGYHFVNWSDASTNNPRTDTNVTANITVTANFAINTYTLTYTAGSNGTISGNTTQTVNYNGSGTAVTAVPNTGYHFVNWSDASTSNPRTDTNVTANITVTANFAANASHTITASGDSGGTISPSGSVSVADGGSQTFNITANSGYNITNVAVDGVSQGAISSYTFTNVTVNHTIYATFYTTVISGTSGNITVPSNQTNYVVNASTVAQTTITVTTNASPVSIDVTRYSGNPHPEAPLPANMVPKYNDIIISNTNAVIWPMHVEIAYTDSDIAGIVESSLRMYYFQGSTWHVCSDTGVNTSGKYVWANLTEAEAAGSPIIIGGNQVGAPTTIGGTVFSVNKVQILLPWLSEFGAFLLFVVLSTMLVVKKRRVKR